MADPTLSRFAADACGRLDRARASLAECIRKQSHCTAAESVKVAKLYEKLRVVKFDPITEGFHLKHGALLDQVVITRAIAAPA